MILAVLWITFYSFFLLWMIILYELSGNFVNKEFVNNIFILHQKDI